MVAQSFQNVPNMTTLMTVEFSIPEGKHGDEEHRHKNDEQHPHHDDRPAGPAAEGWVFGDIRIDRPSRIPGTLGCS